MSRARRSGQLGLRPAREDCGWEEQPSGLLANRHFAHFDGAAEIAECLLHKLSDREREICATLGPALRERGLLFVGIDVIDGNLTEINVTSPTGSRAIQRLNGPDVAAMIWDTIEKKRAAK